MNDVRIDKIVNIIKNIIIENIPSYASYVDFDIDDSVKGKEIILMLLFGDSKEDNSYINNICDIIKNKLPYVTDCTGVEDYPNDESIGTTSHIVIYVKINLSEYVDVNDRFEKWEERKINEEYDYEKDEFEVGDKVRIKKTSKYYDWQPDEPFEQGEIGVVYEIIHGESLNVCVKWENSTTTYRNSYSSKTDLELVEEEPLDDRFEKWEENINEEYNTKIKVGDKVIIDFNMVDNLDIRNIYKKLYNVYKDKIGKVKYISILAGTGTVLFKDKSTYVFPLELVKKYTDDDRFEKWEESVNEEYDHENNKFEVGDKVILNDIIKKDMAYWCIEQKHLIDNIGVVVSKINNIVYVNFLTDNYIFLSYYNTKKDMSPNGFGLYDYWLDLVKEPLDDRFEKWEEKINGNEKKEKDISMDIKNYNEFMNEEIGSVMINKQYIHEYPYQLQSDDSETNPDVSSISQGLIEKSFEFIQEYLKEIISKEMNITDQEEVQKISNTFFNLGKNNEIKRMVDSCKDQKKCAKEIYDKYVKLVQVKMAKDDDNDVENTLR